MVSSLYWVIDFVFVIVLSVIRLHDRKEMIEMTPQEKSFRSLIGCVVFFCLQDAVWGIVALKLTSVDWPLLVCSTIFHITTVVIMFCWLRFVLTYLNARWKMRRVLQTMASVIIGFQLLLLIRNLFVPTIFSIQHGVYVTQYLRPLAFINQYVVYVVIGLLGCYNSLTTEGNGRHRFFSVFVFSLPPIVAGGFQIFFPYAPYHSMGYFLACFVIHVFVVSEERDELRRRRSDREMRAQMQLSRTDALTGLGNRRSYEEARREYFDTVVDANLVYVSIDINGLKTVNDTLGHKAGDELIVGAAQCLRQCLGGYGEVFRIGGDEFAAIIFATPREVAELQSDLDDMISRWHGQLVNELSLSYGMASKREFKHLNELAVIADQRMYEAKEAYYNSKGIDRRAQMAAFSALCDSYKKILKINLTSDTYSIIRMNMEERTAEMGFNPSISVWLHDFGTSGQVHPDDLAEYLRLTDCAYIAACFDGNKGEHSLIYRRRTNDGYRLTKMEMIPAEDYTSTNKSLYLYVKDIDR